MARPKYQEGDLMPCDPKNYPPNWKALRAHVMARAEGRCECSGHCGADHVEFEEQTRCDAPHSQLIQRHRDYKDRWVPAYSSSGNLNHSAPIKVVLTTAHLCQDAGCDRLDHLIAMCQFCHLTLDKVQHQQTRKRNREAKGAA